MAQRALKADRTPSALGGVEEPGKAHNRVVAQQFQRYLRIVEIDPLFLQGRHQTAGERIYVNLQT